MFATIASGDQNPKSKEGGEKSVKKGPADSKRGLGKVQKGGRVPQFETKKGKRERREEGTSHLRKTKVRDMEDFVGTSGPVSAGPIKSQGRETVVSKLNSTLTGKLTFSKWGGGKGGERGTRLISGARPRSLGPSTAIDGIVGGFYSKGHCRDTWAQKKGKKGKQEKVG